MNFRTLLCCLVLYVTGGCLIPPELTEDLEGENSTPQFIAGIEPPAFFTLAQGEIQEFTVRITDPAWAGPITETTLRGQANMKRGIMPRPHMA